MSRQHHAHRLIDVVMPRSQVGDGGNHMVQVVFNSHLKPPCPRRIKINLIIYNALLNHLFV